MQTSDRIPQAFPILFSVIACLLVSQPILAENAGESGSSESFFDQTPLFNAGEGGYRTYRIPAITITRKGAIIVACSGRLDGHGDWVDIDTFIRRSSDGGKTWEPAQLINNADKVPAENPTFITDPASDTILMLYEVNYARAYLRHSSDEGATWSEPVEITYAFDVYRTRDHYDWHVIAIGPGHGIVLDSGRYLASIWLSPDHSHRPSVSSTIYSDDQGQTWQAGQIIVGTTDQTPNPSEHQLVQLDDGRVMSTIRSESKKYCRLISYSDDGANGWSTPRFDEDLADPICMASIVRYSRAANGGKNRILFCNPDNRDQGHQITKWGGLDRRNLTVRLSHDEGQSWPVSKVIEPGPSGYSDMAVAGDGTIYLFYERSALNELGAFIPGTLTLARFNLAWLTDGADNGD
ncbi:MAG: exo-alpha-sialidase [Phycisphaeraceae bacterium]|nr:exo-alpha-sialidase [Phycisphaeraceae bacterium]